MNKERQKGREKESLSLLLSPSAPSPLLVDAVALSCRCHLQLPSTAAATALVRRSRCTCSSTSSPSPSISPSCSRPTSKVFIIISFYFGLISLNQCLRFHLLKIPKSHVNWCVYLDVQICRFALDVLNHILNCDVVMFAGPIHSRSCRWFSLDMIVFLALLDWIYKLRFLFVSLYICFVFIVGLRYSGSS